MQTTTMEEKMAGNMRDRNLAFQAAEAALRTGEGYLQNTSILPTFNNTNGVYQARDMAPNQWYKDNDTWWMTSANVRSFNTSTFASVAPGTAYILEELAEVARGISKPGSWYSQKL